jgi:hypothetical protein
VNPCVSPLVVGTLQSDVSRFSGSLYDQVPRSPLVRTSSAGFSARFSNVIETADAIARLMLGIFTVRLDGSVHIDNGGLSILKQCRRTPR